MSNPITARDASAPAAPPYGAQRATWSADVPSRTSPTVAPAEPIEPGRLVGSTVAAPAPALLDLPALESIALGNNPTLRQGAARVSAARGACVQSGLYPNPEVGYSAEDMGEEGTSGKQGVFVAQRFVTAGKLGLNRAVAGHAVCQAECALNAQQRRVLNDVRIAYVELLAARRAVELNEQLLQIGHEGVRVTEALRAAQDVSRVSTLQAQIELDAGEMRQAEARNRLETARRRLAAVVGLPELNVGEVAGDLQPNVGPLTFDASLERLLSGSPELAEARAGVARARCALARACAGRVPDVNTEVSVHYDNVTRDTLTGVAVGLPLPLFDRNQGNIQSAQAEFCAASEEVRRLELELRDRMAVAYQRYADAQQKVDRYSQSILPSARQSLDLVTRGFREGEYPYLEMLTAQRTYVNVNLNYLESLRELHSSRIAIEGMLLTGGLANGSDASGAAADARAARSAGSPLLPVVD